MKQKPDQIIETIQARHTFNDTEKIELSLELSRTCSSVNSLEQEKSAITKDYAGRIGTAEIKRDSLVEKIISGYEMRPTDCIVIMDPKNRSKDFFRIHDGLPGEFVERREMTAADFQLTLPEVEERAE
jgi:hypothetical protein